ncbi:HAD family phosphatase [Streptomyces sp. LP05-1]|uniref:HAD family phosphatase n=1 Tax=Streptomyces pyxinae TaxID=2970734 RepID=A0ABT2CFL8_9ACTN|nr:HAD family phosphatase [Streptomyces sp. LP05-1]MCS0636188.1 HAD family phosphatase [Streptomyces sp. LP05-1]
MTAVPCVVLDIGGVLELTPETGWTRRWEDRLGLPPGTVNQRLGDVWRAGSLGRVSEHDVGHAVASRLGLGMRDCEAFMDDLWTEYLGTPNEELIDFVRGLRGRCRLGILSNSFTGARERESARYGFDRLVDHIVYSHELGVAKPDPRAYEAVLSALDARPEDCLFIDDAPACVAGAEALGMRGGLFEDNAGTIARITRHLDAYATGPRPVRRDPAARPGFRRAPGPGAHRAG